MFKKLLVLSLLATCSNAFAEGTLTEQLKKTIDPNNVRIVYDTYLGTAERGIAPLKRLTFAKRGKDFYIQKDFPIFKPVDPIEVYKKQKRAKAGGAGAVITGAESMPTAFDDSSDVVVGYVGSLQRDQFNIITEQSRPTMPNIGGGIGFVLGALSQMAAREQNKVKDLYDLCIGLNGKIYMLNRGVEKGHWINAEDAKPEKLINEANKILSEIRQSSNGLNLLLSASTNQDMKLVKTYKKIIGIKYYTAEEFVTQPVTDEGLPQGQENHITFLYRDGKLEYIDEGSNGFGGGNVMGMNHTLKHLNKIVQNIFLLFLSV